MSSSAPSHGSGQTGLTFLCLAALGVVYGDIGTSPLYSIKECFHGLHAIPVTEANVLGVCSMIFWALTMVISFKYVSWVLHADNHGEGGTFALAALFLGKGKDKVSPRTTSVLTLLAIFGASLLYGEGVITPAISVLSAVEGLSVATEAAQPYVLPITCVILLGLFLVQRHGTEHIGRVFGPVMVFWFAVLAALGASEILDQPRILQALNPAWAVRFFLENGYHGMIVLGSVVLCITGGEALYADMGHFGLRPIRLSWHAVVFPALILNYFGQAALLLQYPEAAANPFYSLVPRNLLYPMVGLSTVATVIASQAMISGVFSLTQQAIQLGFCPRLRIVHTSGEHKGQIYMPWINGVMMIACLGLALGFKESSRLAAAYGIGVTCSMTITSLIFFFITRHNWNWPLWKSLSLCGVFWTFDLIFLKANLLKFFDGGWMSISLATCVAVLLVTWRDGRALLAKRFQVSRVPEEALIRDVATYKPYRQHGTAAFLSVTPTGVPIALLHYVKHNEAIYERIVLMSFVSAETPTVPLDKRLEIRDLGEGFYRVVARYGFMETPGMPEVLELAAARGLELDPYATSFYLGRETILPTGEGRMARWRKSLFIIMSKNAWNVSHFFGLPPNRVVEMGSQVEL